MRETEMTSIDVKGLASLTSLFVKKGAAAGAFLLMIVLNDGVQPKMKAVITCVHPSTVPSCLSAKTVQTVDIGSELK